MTISHRTEAVLTGAAGAITACLAIGSATHGDWPGVLVFGVLAVLLARISTKEQHAALGERDEAVRAELASRPRDDEQCPQHPTAPRIGGMCGMCTQYPADFPKERRP